MFAQIPAHKLSPTDSLFLNATLLGDYLFQDYLNFEAIHSDETRNYVFRILNNNQLAKVRFRLRVLKDNVDSAFFHTSSHVFAMYKAESFGLFDFFDVVLDPLEYNYYFVVNKNNRSFFYSKLGCSLHLDHDYLFKFLPDFTIPDWAIGAVIYQIYVDRFFNGDSRNDVLDLEYTYLGRVSKRIRPWLSPVDNDDICNFYGGDLEGVIQKLDYLKNLGVDAIYLSPIFVSPSNHKYDTQDYDYIDPHFGVLVRDSGSTLSLDKLSNKFASKYIIRSTSLANLEASNALFRKLVRLAHNAGIRIILDGVFNHCGAFNKWLDKEAFYLNPGFPSGAYRDRLSPFHDFFIWYDSNWPNNDCYLSWWNHDNHPKLNYDNPALYNYILNIAKKWVSPPFDADGWRLDVAADLGPNLDLNHRFWADFRSAVKLANPQAIIIAEHYGDPSPWLDGLQWDSIMNYDAFMEPITWFLTGMEKHSEAFNPDLLNNAFAFEGAMRYFMARMYVSSLHSAMNQLSNHDHSRFLTRTNRKVGRLHSLGPDAADSGVNLSVFMAAVVFQMTWPGSPTLYYADEAGLTGWTDPDNRRPYPWGRENSLLLDFHRKIIALRKRFDVFRHGSVEFLFNDYGVLSFGRFDNSHRIAVVINNNDVRKFLAIPVWKLGVNPFGHMDLLFLTCNDDFSTESLRYQVSAGFIKITLEAHASAILLDVGFCDSSRLSCRGD